MKIITQSSHEWQNGYSRLPIHYFISYTQNLMPWIHKSARNNHRSIISPVSQRTLISDLALWRHHTVTSRERGIMALWRRIRWLFLHSQIGAMLIYMWITTVNIDFPPPGTHGLACKKIIPWSYCPCYQQSAVIVLWLYYNGNERGQCRPKHARRWLMITAVSCEKQYTTTNLLISVGYEWLFGSLTPAGVKCYLSNSVFRALVGNLVSATFL